MLKNLCLIISIFYCFANVINANVNAPSNENNLQPVKSASSIAPGKNILVTSVLNEFGKSIALYLAKKNYNLVLADSNQEQLDQLKNEISSNYPIAISTILIDYGQVNSMEQAAKATPNLKLDGLVIIPARPVLTRTEIPDPLSWGTAFVRCFISPLETIRQFSPKLINNSSIVIISGITSVNHIPSYPNSNVLKIVWNAEIKNLTHFLGNRSIRVNAISSGVILNTASKEALAQRAAKQKISYAQQLAKEVEGVPLGRYAETDDISKTIEYLLSPQSSYLNGVNLPLDGGENTTY